MELSVYSKTKKLVTRVDSVDRITREYEKTVNSTLMIGKYLLKDKYELPHGEFMEMVENELPFGSRTAQVLMQISRNTVLANTQSSAVLPRSLSALVELAKIKPDLLERELNVGSIHPDMTCKDAQLLYEKIHNAQYEKRQKEFVDTPQPERRCHVRGCVCYFGGIKRARKG